MRSLAWVAIQFHKLSLTVAFLLSLDFMLKRDTLSHMHNAEHTTTFEVPHTSHQPIATIPVVGYGWCVLCMMLTAAAVNRMGYDKQEYRIHISYICWCQALSRRHITLCCILWHRSPSNAIINRTAAFMKSSSSSSSQHKMQCCFVWSGKENTLLRTVHKNSGKIGEIKGNDCI